MVLRPAPILRSVASSDELPDQVQYSHVMFGWERRFAATGVRRLRARGDPGGFLAAGLESYGYLVCAAIWGSAAGVIAICVGFPLLVIQKGASLASWLVVLVVALLALMVFIRVRQSKLARNASNRQPVAVTNRPSIRRQKLLTWLFLVSAIYLGIPGIVLAANSSDQIASVILCLAAVGWGWLGIRRLRRLSSKRPSP